MSEIIVTEANFHQQYFAQSGAEMRQLLAPMRRYGVRHFAYMRSTPKYKHMLTTHPEFSLLFYKERFHSQVFTASPDEYVPGAVFLDDLIATSKNTDVLLNIKQACVEYSHFIPALTYIEKDGDSVDFYWFGTSDKGCYTQSYYIRHLPIFKSYIDFFKQAGKLLLQKCYENKMIYHGGTDLTSLTSRSIREKIDLIDGANSCFLNKRPKFLLSAREKLVACYLHDGFSCQEIASCINTSPRTVEKQIFSLREKMKSRSLSHLIARLNQLYWLG